MKNGIFETVEKLHSLQLFDDLVFFNELCINENKIAESLKIDEQAYVYSCIGDAYSEGSNLCLSEKWYDYSINALTAMKRQGVINRFDEIINISEARFRLHKTLLKARRFEKALKCLEAIPKTECSPKVQYAIAKLSLRQKKTDKSSTISRQIIINNLRSILKQVPEAFFSKSMLFLMENGKTAEIEPSLKSRNSELTAWLTAKQAESRRNFSAALNCLNKFSMHDNFMIVSETAHYFRIMGDKRKALDLYEKAHTMNRSMLHGMDEYAALLFQAKRAKDLEILVENLIGANSHAYQTYVALAYLSRAQRRPREAILSLTQRALSVANTGRQRAEVLLFKGQIYLEMKRFKECDVYCQEAHIYDNSHTECYELHVQSLRFQKLSAKACSLVKLAVESLGDNNQRAQYMMALILAENATNSSEAIERLEKIVEKASFMTDALNLLMHMYDRHKHYDKGVKLARKFLEVHVDAGARKILNDFLIKYGQPTDRAQLIKFVEQSKSSSTGAGVTPVDMTTPDIAHSSPSSSNVFSGRAGLPPPPIAPVRMRRLAQPAAFVHSTQSDVVPLDMSHLSPPLFDESAEMMDEWSERPTQQSSSDTVVGSQRSSTTSSTQLSISTGVTTRAARRNSSLFLATSSAASSTSRSQIATLHASTGSVSSSTSLDYDQLQHRVRRRNMSAAREHEIARAIHAHRDRLTARRQLPHSTPPVNTLASEARAAGMSTPPGRGLDDSFPTDSLNDDSRGGLEEEEEIDGIADLEGDAEFFSETAANVEEDFSLQDNDNEVEMVDDDSDEFSERVIM